MTKSNIVRNAGIAAASGALLAASVAPANAFAVAEVSAPSYSAPSLADYSAPTTSWDYSAPTTSWDYYQGSTVVESTSSVSTQSNGSAEIPADVSGARATVLAAAQDGVGGAYIWGGEGYKAWDCSGFVSYVFAQSGISLTSYTFQMKNELAPTSNPQPGDIVFTNNYNHVGIYVGNGQMISALNPSQGTQLTSVDGGGMMPVDGYYTVAGL